MLKTVFNIQSKGLFGIGLGTSLLILSSLIKVPFYPVAFTLHTLMIGLNYLLLGSQALYSIIFYTVLGVLGLPVLSSPIIYATGYLAGMILGAFIMQTSTKNTITKYLLATASAYILGLAWLQYLGFSNFNVMFWAYMPGEAFKLLMFIGAYKLKSIR